MARQRTGGARPSQKPADVIRMLMAVVEKDFPKVVSRPISPTAHDFATQFTHSFNRLPNPNESAAVAVGLEKTAALFFDRVWAPGPFVIPLDDVRFSGTSEGELDLHASVFSTVEEVTGRPIQFDTQSHPFNTSFPLNGDQLRDLFARAVREGEYNIKITVDEKPTVFLTSYRTSARVH
jgi:hypothetical protein